MVERPARRLRRVPEGFDFGTMTRRRYSTRDRHGRYTISMIQNISASVYANANAIGMQDRCNNINEVAFSVRAQIQNTRLLYRERRVGVFESRFPGRKFAEMAPLKRIVGIVPGIGEKLANERRHPTARQSVELLVERKKRRCIRRQGICPGLHHRSHERISTKPRVVFVKLFDPFLYPKKNICPPLA